MSKSGRSVTGIISSEKGIHLTSRHNTHKVPIISKTGTHYGVQYAVCSTLVAGSYYLQTRQKDTKTKIKRLFNNISLPLNF